MLDPARRTAGAAGRRAKSADGTRARGAAADLRRPFEPRYRGAAAPQRQHGRGTPREHHEHARRAQDRRARHVRASARPGEPAAAENRREFNGEPARVPATLRRHRSVHAAGAAGWPAGWRARLSPRRCHRRRRGAVPAQQRRLRRQAAAGDARGRLRVPRLRRRWLAGHPAGQRDGLAGPQASAVQPELSIGTIATARSRTSPARPVWTSRCTGWESLSAISTTTASPTCW